MAISRFNYTGLRKIHRRDVRITLKTFQDVPPEFTADLSSLANYNFPGDASVFVEAYRQTTWMRFPFGTIKAIVSPVDTKLVEFNSHDEIRFRVRVTAASENFRKVLGEADQIRPVGELDADDERSPLLKVRPADLGDEVYRVEIEQTPILLVNRNVGDWRAVVASPVFQALTAPAILRTVLTHLLVIEDASDPDDSESPHVRWLRFANSLPGVGECPEDTDARLGWIDDVVSSFAKQKRVLESFMNNWQKG
jgi:hypothetical protein